MNPAPKLRYSYEDYLRSLERSELKLEYCAGVIYAMAGGTPSAGSPWWSAPTRGGHPSDTWAPESG